MTMAWESELQTSQKMAMLAMCDWANDDGGSVYPSIAKLAKRISCSERQAQRIVHALIDDGLVAVVGNALGGVPGQSRQYRINVAKLYALSMGATVKQIKPNASPVERGDILSPVESGEKQGGGVTFETETGDMGVTLSPLYPSLNTPLPPDGGASGFEDFWKPFPKKIGEAKARRQWGKLAPDVAMRRLIVDAVRVQAATANWQKAGGQYVPMPCNWLRDRRWLDDCVGTANGLGCSAAPVLVEGSRAHVAQLAERVGLPAWDGVSEPFPVYKARVMGRVHAQAQTQAHTQAQTLASERVGV